MSGLINLLRTHLAEADKVHDVERTKADQYRTRPTRGRTKSDDLPDMVRSSLKEILPVPRLPEPEAFHVRVVVAHRCIAIGSSVEVDLVELLHIGTYDLVRINEDHLLEVHWEENIEEEDFVRPDDTLFLFLGTQPGRPLVCDKLVLEAILGSEVWNEFLRQASA
jgi:hypothetical protein